MGRMNYDFAPMEGVTGWIYRRAHCRHFSGVRQYYMPFFSPTQEHRITKREMRDLAPENNQGIPVVPQVLTRRAEDFVWAAARLHEMGYEEVNLNLGCPSGTVAAKGKGAGFLAFPQELDAFLEQVFAQVRVPVSIKTRLGVQEPEEFAPLLDIYRAYPLKRLIVHPRVRKDMYRGAVREEYFARAIQGSPFPVCYNGDIITVEGARRVERHYPHMEGMMLGRGLVGDPALAQKLQGGPAADKASLRAMHDEIYEGYCSAFGSAHNAMMRMKELWYYQIALFEGSEPWEKQLKKVSNPQRYVQIVDEIWEGLELRANLPGVR